MREEKGRRGGGRVNYVACSWLGLIIREKESWEHQVALVSSGQPAVPLTPLTIHCLPMA